MNIMKHSDLINPSTGFALAAPTQLLQNRLGCGQGRERMKGQMKHTKASKGFTLLKHKVTMMSLDN